MLADRIIATGLLYLATPYSFKAPAAQTKKFDCSSFVQYVFGLNGITLPRSSRQQFQAGDFIAFDSLQKGDLLFFTNEQRTKKTGIAKIGHVAIYMGNNLMLHTYHLGAQVTISELNSYWTSMFMGAKRVI
ncbi:C40 family peptidase [Bacillus sp. 165]|uniref:C40 family peptidase n=1 Tax=Bacillus sp. 165 TaxID=1529117 RepID=UPI001ADC1F0E|nr:C40 family peptidase [Bacillus sp. 165]MBO9130981.1 C40 family peptidase [Bacillus sp. 165]